MTKLSDFNGFQSLLAKPVQQYCLAMQVFFVHLLLRQSISSRIKMNIDINHLI